MFTLCDPNSIPNTNWWNGSFSYLRVSGIGVSGAAMTFDFRGAGSQTEDADGDGISDWNETRDLVPGTPGVQNPFDPENPDVTGDNGETTPDGIPDGENDFDGDSVSNAVEFSAGTDPLDPTSGMPVTTPAGLILLSGLILAAWRRQAHKS